MPGMFWTAPVNSPGLGAGSALASSTTLTDISPAPQLQLPAGFLSVGSRFRVRAFGNFSTTGTPTLLIGAYYGGVAGVALAASGATTTASGATTLPWRLDVDVEVRTSGASGTAMCEGILHLGTSLTAMSVIPVPATALATVTIDTTTAKAITVGAQWGTSSASNTITCQGFYVESQGL